MSYLKILFLVTAVLLFGTRSVFATDYAVGTCEPKLTSYTKISDAVSLVPAGSIVDLMLTRGRRRIVRCRCWG